MPARGIDSQMLWRLRSDAAEIGVLECVVDHIRASRRCHGNVTDVTLGAAGHVFAIRVKRILDYISVADSEETLLCHCLSREMPSPRTTTFTMKSMKA